MYRSLAIVLGIIVLKEGQMAIGKEVDVDSASTIQHLLSCQKVNDAFRIKGIVTSEWKLAQDVK